jgi:sigma-E factor negative regulatory protein RseA
MVEGKGTMNDRISELMDGELDDREAERLIGALGGEGEARDAWRRYHLIGDAMRDTRALSAGFAARVAHKIALEPTVLAPRQREHARPRSWFAVPAAVAAGLAGISVVGWLALAPQAQAPAPVAAVAPTTAQAQPAPAQPQTIPLPSATADYLLAHQGFSPRLPLQGMSAYARTVSAEAAGDRR